VAWHVAAIGRAKRLPSLSSLIKRLRQAGDDQTPEPQDWQSVRDWMMAREAVQSKKKKR
jgi:hypothetical protein